MSDTRPARTIEPYVTRAERAGMPRILERRGPGEIKVEFTSMGRVEVGDGCTGCRLCVRICPAQALKLNGERSVKMIGEFSACIACGDCVAICAPQAIRITRPIRYGGYYKSVGMGDLSGPRLF